MEQAAFFLRGEAAFFLRGDSVLFEVRQLGFFWRRGNEAFFLGAGN